MCPARVCGAPDGIVSPDCGGGIRVVSFTRGKVVQLDQAACRAHLKDDAQAVCATVGRDTVDVTVGTRSQRLTAGEIRAFGGCKAMNELDGAAGHKAEYTSLTGISTCCHNSIQRLVRSEDQCRH